MTTLFTGLPASPGIASGRLAIYNPQTPDLLLEPESFEPTVEWQRFLQAQASVDAELAEMDQRENPLLADIFSAHRMILQDRTLVDTIRERIQEGHSASAAVQKTIYQFADLFSRLEDAYFASRTEDISDIGLRLRDHLSEHAVQSPLANLPAQTILVAHDLTPSEIAELPADHVLGIVLAGSAPTAHSAILARSLGIPMACTFGPGVMNMAPGQTAILDGHSGRLLVDPSATEVDLFADRRQYELLEQSAARELAQTRAVTLDGVHIPVYANANAPSEIAQSVEMGADGIGLLRTEYLYQGRATPPTMEEQEQTYQRFADLLGDRLLTIRALDAGGDKPVGFMIHDGEDNPFLGLRGIRLLLTLPGLLRTQFEAFLRVAQAAYRGNGRFRFMLPMISSTQEVEDVRNLIADLLAVEEAHHVPPHAVVKLGVLVEVPAAALTARHLAPTIDFFSIGTNDLAQYVLASDRTNSSVAGLVDPLHPAVLQLIERTCSAAAEAGIPASLCGEVAGEPAAIPLLLGLGVTELSVPLPAVALVKQAIRRCDMMQCRQLTEQALVQPDAASVRRLLVQSP